MENERLRITVLEPTAARQMRPSLQDIVHKLSEKTVDVSMDTVSARLCAEIDRLHRLFSAAKLSFDKSRVTSATLALGIDAQGEVSLCSIATANITGKGIITIHFEFYGGHNG
jgi:hypothetical protein